MPISNNPDKFFTSNFNFQVLRELQDAMLREMLSLNPIQNGMFNKHTLILFAKIKAIHAAIKSENIFTQSIFNDKLKAIQLQMKIDNENLQNELKNNKLLQENLLNEIRNYYVDYINEAFRETRIALGDHKDTESRYTFTMGKSLAKTEIISSKGFPQFGFDVPNYNDSVDDYINSGGFNPFKAKDSEGNIIEFKTEKGTPIFNGWSVKTKNGYIPDPMKNLTKNRDATVAYKPLIDSFYSNKLQAPPGAMRFFIEKLHGAYSDFKPYQKNGVVSEKLPGYNQNLSNRTVFAAFIDSISENFSVSENDVNFLGASEAFSVYQSTSRTLNLTFSIISDYSLEYLLALQEVYKSQQIDKDISEQINRIKQLSYFDKGLGFFGMPGTPGEQGLPNMYADTPETLWKKVTFMQQCVYPYYRLDGKMKEMPMIRLRLGDYLDVNGKITDLQIETDEYENIMDYNPSSLGTMPFAVKISISVKVIHDWMPSSNFFGFWNRKEFDNGKANKQTGEGLFVNKTKFGDANTKFEDGVTESDAKGSVKSKELDQISIEQQMKDELNSELKRFNVEFRKYKIDKASGLKVDDKEEVKKQVGILERINELTESLKNLYGYTSAPISTSTGLKERFQNEIDGFNSAKNQFEELFGGVNANLNAVNDKLRIAEQKLLKVGVNVKASEEVSDVVKKINELRFRNLIPKKLKDILN